MKRLAAAVLAGVAMAAAPTAAATPAEGDVERTDLATGTTSEPIVIDTQGRPTTLYVQELLLHPPSNSGWHTHPGPEHTVITGGTVAIQTAQQCTPRQYLAGEAVFIPAGVPHIVRNDSPHDANAVVTYTLPADLPVRDDAPAACP
ncbi:cupin domain-containing protein [Mycolicibacterium diernhoferi]|uniref:Cupin n=1 Tax=Mycolicibacterium diernhoferi TaxID=1801 RepID=A0A1Q4HID6_9MYCO|nr:cupin domain-containing protein [Mycolicibacterium diernhoferi]OJZ67151.1 cupin [Mycolicibacterium diernhoferi]OPE51280.1 cupin [Mycolicibacterium diernhoferi]PEG53625.1 cupin domain-containing protein [Mycolicibacterium diernhoferi]QYL23352.1 cupin domain-containing protein [Mycolicibacterium diernhoferi]